MDLERFAPGQTHSADVHVTPQQVRAFADATGDHNPIHLDEAFAAGTRFKRTISHGALLLGLISRVLGTEFPGAGTIYVSQSAHFLKPVFVGSSVRIVLTVKGVDSQRRRLTLDTRVKDSAGEDCVTGEAEVYLPKG
jgi:3-hydroxybutyryl-CoA dehydratase